MSYLEKLIVQRLLKTVKFALILDVKCDDDPLVEILYRGLGTKVLTECDKLVSNIFYSQTAELN